MLWMLTSLALAQELPPPPEEPDPALLSELTQLREALAAEEARSAASQALLDAASTVAAPASMTADKVSAIAALAALGDRRALPFLELAARQESEVRVAVLGYAGAFSDDPRMHTLVTRLSQLGQPEAVQLAAVTALDAAQVPDALGELWRMATDEESSALVREAARAQLSVNHAEAVAARGGLPSVFVKLDPVATNQMAISSALIGGAVLSTVGQLGQTDAGTAIGAGGGALIGGGLGLVAARANNVSVENAYQYSTGTVLGGVAGLTLAGAVEAEGEGFLYLMTLGTVAGAGGALLNFQNEPSVEDTTEFTTAVVLGQQIGAGAYRWASDDDGSSVAQLASLAGGVAGGVTGLLVRPSVSLDGDDVSLMTAGGTAGLWLSLLVPPAMDWEVSAGAVQTAIPVGTLAGAVASQVYDVPAKQTGISGYGFASGNLLGLGAALMGSPESGQPVAQAVLAGGVAGAAAGAVLSPRMTFDTGDAVIVPVGSLLTVAEATGIAFVLDQKTDFEQPGGLIALSAGLGTAGWGLATQALDVQPGQALLVAAGAGWGLFYGGLTPFALGLEGEPEDLVLTILVTGDVLMAGAAIAQTDAIGLTPQATVLPQLGGVGGAVVGALGVALFNGEGQAVSAGSLGGSLVGLGVGVALESRYGSDWIPRLEARAPRLDLPGTWKLSAAPTVLEGDELGMYLGVQARGL